MLKKLLIVLCLLLMVSCQKKQEASYFLDGLKLIQEGNYGEAVLYFQEMISVDPKNIEGYIGTITVYAVMNDKEQVDYYVQQIVDIFPDDKENIFDKISAELIKLDKNESNEYLSEVVGKVQEGTFHYRSAPVWIVEPQFLFDDVDVVSSQDYRITAGSFMNSSENYDACYPNAMEYTLVNQRNCNGYYDSGFVKVVKDGQYGIYDFSGNEVKSFGDIDFQFGYTYTVEGDIYLGYSTTTEVFDQYEMIDHYDVTYYGKYFDQNNKFRGTPNFALDGYFLNKNGANVNYCNNDGCFGIETILDQSNGAFLIDSQTIINQEGQVISLDGYAVDGISNGYIRVTDKQINYWTEIPRIEDYRFGFYDLFGNRITDFTYENAYDFTGGYAAVKYEELWGYIDEEGTVVVPFVFEESRPVYEGKAWVKKNGLWGILDITKSVEKQADFLK